MLVKLLIALVVVAPVVVLVVSAIRGRVRVQSCCSVPADRDARLRSAPEATAALDDSAPMVSASAAPPAP